MKHILNGQEVTPSRYEDIGLVIDYNDPVNVISVNVDTLTLTNEAIDIINNWRFTIGLHEGIPYDFILNNGKVLNYFVDLTDSFTIDTDEFGAVYMKVKVKRRYSNDAFMTQARGLSFQNLVAKGVNYDSTAVQVPYLIIKDNVLEQSISLAITLYVMSEALYIAIRDAVWMIQELVQAVDPSPAHLIGAIAKITAHIIYTTALLLAVIKLAQQLRELLLPKIRHYKANSMKNLIKKGCEYLGYTLQSTLLDSLEDLYVLGVPMIKGKEDIFDIIENDLNFAFNKSYPTELDTIRTLGEAIESVLTTFNAKILTYQNDLGQNIVRIERRDFNFNTYNSTLTPALNIQGKRMDFIQFNTNEIWKRQFCKFMIDGNDKHTMNDFDATDCEDSTDPITVVNADLVMIKRVNEINIPFAMGSRKNNLNWIENRLQDLFGFIDDVVNELGGSSNLVSPINNRVGCLQISEQFFTVTKLLYLKGTIDNKKQPADYKSFISARRIANDFHAIDFIGVNDFIIRELCEANISDDEFSQLQFSNYASINGENCELLRVEYLDEKNLSKITYKEPFDWAFNLQKNVIN